ncbi:TraE/TraK family type IV conjugative transfer system protein [Sinimarinibacterium sp. NLF-5-8]|uniref:TraE/TraK family type IV conjugative transfer system protein n=1 Tax=Sinimarinibacterium sp. NLF-5-8 TaxID=2698684 RepID=UPI00137C2309|nr:TraE/TraK family type IV conjugative transfer system protein [Sinimarinibacterium sp. NLF-5-8]QHS09082.1 hypothetical protein GT972_02240 [Sinimarinibacterium sp. NLF-5-8]
MTTKTTNYAGMVHNSAKAIQAWKFATLALMVSVILLSFIALKTSNVQRTVLVPYSIATANESVRVSGSPETDGEYLTHLARADISMMLTWQPGNISTQMDGFLGRLSPSAYAQYNLDLRATVKEYASMNVSEVFHLNKVTYTHPYRVSLSGRLMRWTGDKLTVDTQATYTLTYTMYSGIYAINDVETN